MEEEQGSSKPHRPHANVPEEKRATEYLANERTFLAWIRTSIAVISFGFVITRFGIGSMATPVAWPITAC